MPTVTHADLERAAARLAGHVHRTPLLRCASLDAAAGCAVALKAENLQRVGAFKIRGALNAILQLSPEATARGVVAHSSGNHAQGVALAAKIAGTHAVVVMPGWASANKVAATRGYGAEVFQDGVTGENRDEIAARFAAERGLELIHPFDDDRIIAGQGTVGLEIVADAPALDAVYVPIGGGGLIAGVATAVKALSPGTRVVGVETEGADDAARSLASGQRVHLAASPATIADGIRTLAVGERNWDIIRRLVDEIVVVSDDDVLATMHLLLERAKLVTEPTGAVAAAALVGRRHAASGARVAAVISGGNLDFAWWADTLRKVDGGRHL